MKSLSGVLILTPGLFAGVGIMRAAQGGAGTLGTIGAGVPGEINGGRLRRRDQFTIQNSQCPLPKDESGTPAEAHNRANS
jgi:hypothetical protein